MDWNAAIEGLQSLSVDFGDALVEVEPGRCLNVRAACTALLCTLPAPGRTWVYESPRAWRI